jgi:hypothetical protein
MSFLVKEIIAEIRNSNFTDATLKIPIFALAELYNDLYLIDNFSSSPNGTMLGFST